VKPASPDRFLNRELSWLDFNARVLALAEDPELPLLERVKFLAISARNLDEFFQVRVAGLKAQVDAGVLAASPDGRSPVEQLQEIRLHVEELLRRQERVHAKELLPRLAEQSIRFIDWDALDAEERKRLRHEYERRIHPALTPLAVDPAHPFPWISNLTLNLAVLVDDAAGERHRAREVPPVFPLRRPGDGGCRRASGDRRPHGPALPRARRHLLVDEGEADNLLVNRIGYRRLRVNDAARLSWTPPAPVTAARGGLDLAEGDVYLQRAPRPRDLGRYASTAT
jgi:hypothetical protein